MYSSMMEKRMEQLHQRLRILILQNAREESDYDIRFLQEVRQLADEILHLKKRYNEVRRTTVAKELVLPEF